MGKIRVKTLGIEDLEKQQQKKAKKRAEQKKTAKVPGLKGGERVVAVGPTEEEIEKMAVEPAQEEPKKEEKSAKGRSSSGRKEKFKKEAKSKRSKKYKTVVALVDKKKTYALLEALELLPKLHLAKFDETVELHINTLETGVSGNLSLPHGTGKKVRVAIADDQLIETIAKGKIDFDVLLATPQMMPKLAKVAKFLGPRGLMPNPKNGTITAKPEEVAKTYEKGMTSFKTESKAPLIHLTIGKMSFGDKKLSDNIKAAVNAIQATRIKKVTLKSTMSPGITLDIAKL